MAELSALRVPASELAQYRSVAHIGNKKQQEKSVSLSKRPDEAVKRVEELNSVKGAKRRKLEIEEKPESSSSEESSDSEDENIADQKMSPDAPVPETKVGLITSDSSSREKEKPTATENNSNRLEPEETKENRIKMPPQNLVFVPVERPRDVQVRV